MSVLSSLKLVAAKKPTFVSPVQARRNKLSTRLWEQIELAKAQSNGTVFAPTRTKTIRDDEGNTRTVERSRRIKQWWFVSEAGKVCIAIRYGARVLELAKGKSAIEVATPADLIMPSSRLSSTLRELMQNSRGLSIKRRLTSAPSKNKLNSATVISIFP